MKTPPLATIAVLTMGILSNAAFGEVDSSAVWEVTERGPHYREMRCGEAPSLDGGEAKRVSHRYVELGTGMHYRDAQGVWQESRPEFQLNAQGYAVAARGRHKAIISPVLTDERGAVDLETPDGRRMRSTLRALYLFNRGTGRSLLIADANPKAVGLLVNTNEVLFTNAFSGFGANVRYQYRRADFHQDVILTERLDLEALEAAGFPAKVTSIEIWTEFLEAPEARVVTRLVRKEQDARLRSEMAEPDILDDELDFGEMQMRRGVAYLQAPSLPDRKTEIRVVKSWRQLEGRQFLIESIPLDKAESLLSQLPAGASFQDSLRDKPQYAGRRVPPPVQGRNEGQTIQIAGLDTRQLLAGSPRLVMDYVVSGSASTYTFRGDTTYYITSGAFIVGDAIFEGGTVLKFERSTDAVVELNNVTFNTSPYRPAILTAEDDHSVGETIVSPGGRGYPIGYYGSGLLINSQVDIHDLRVTHLWKGIGFWANYDAEFRNVQFGKCYIPIDAPDMAVTIKNGLFWNNASFFLGASTLTGEHLTVVDCGSFSASSLKNCLVAGQTSFNNNFPTADKVFGPVSKSGLFQTVRAGQFYLAANSIYRDIGTTGISPDLLTALGTMTTHPPDDHSAEVISTGIAWPVFAPRDDDGQPDVGYHYPALDYLVNDITVAGANLILDEGVAVAGYGSEGIVLQDGGQLTSQGTRCKQSQICSYQAVQEQTVVLNSAPPPNMTLLTSSVTTTPAQLQARFTHFNGLAGLAGVVDLDNVAMDLRNCALYSGKFSCFTPAGDVDGPAKVSMVNNLFERAEVAFDDLHAGCSLDFYNNTAIGSSVDFQHLNQMAPYREWRIRDNLFDHSDVTAASASEISTPIIAGNNLKRGGNVGVSATELLADVAYASGPFGGRYIDTSYAYFSLFANAGSRSAALAGLSAYTIRTDDAQDIDTVDIGFHYPVEDLSGGTFWTDSGVSADAMARAIMAGTGATVVPGSASFTGATMARGFFGNGSDADLPVQLEQGVMLCSGNIGLAHGPNNLYGSNHEYGMNNGLPGDVQFQSLVPGIITTDAAILEFDITASTTIDLSFKYLFGSEEYHYYINDKNDIMAIWVDGVNTAVVPTESPSSDPVAVNFIHNGNPYTFPEPDPVNDQYFVDNEIPAPTLNIQYNGLTILLTTTTTTIPTGGLRHIKIAIADAVDFSLDSAVFIKASVPLSCP